MPPDADQLSSSSNKGRGGVTRVSGVAILPIPREQAWPSLSDPSVFGAHVASAQDIRVVDERTLRAVIRPASVLGTVPVQMEFTIVEPVEPESVSIIGRGWSSAGEVMVDAQLALRPSDDGGAEVTWTLDAAVFGALRAMTQRVLPALVRLEADRFFHGVAQEHARVYP